MEFFKEGVEVRLKSHLDKYLVAGDDQVTVRQSDRAAGTCRARWLTEHVDSNSHVIRLKSCYGGYLTASNKPFLGLLGKQLVLQTLEENILANEWQPVRDGFQVKLKALDGTYLRANGAMPPWRNTVTHDMTNSQNNDNWILFDVETVDDQEDSIIKSMVTGFSWVSDEISPVSIIHYSSTFSPLTPILSIIQKRRRRRSSWLEERERGSVSVMEVFENAKAVRLKNSRNKYLHADDDQESVSQDRNGSSKNNRWTVEFLNDNQIIRLKSCYNKYLTASNQPFLLGMTGRRKVLQTLPTILDSSVEWEPIREGNQVKLRTRYGQYLRANGGHVPPWRNSVTHDVPADHRTASQQSVLWDVDVVDIVILNSPVPTPPPPLLTRHSSSFNSSSSTSTTNTSLSQQHQDSPREGVKLEEGRRIYYHVVSYEFAGEMDENGFAIITFKGNNLNDLTRKLEEETGLNNITICTRSPLNGNLYPLRLQLPPNNVTLKVVVVPNSPSPSPSSYQDT